MPALLPSTSRAHVFNTPHLRVTAGACSVQGLEHDQNEDREYISPQHDLFIVADGMGTHSAGKAASQFAVDTLNHELGRIQDGPYTAAEVKHLVRTAIKDAHCLIMEMGDLVPTYKGGEAAVVLALLFGERLFVSGVGDSRAYLLRGGVLEQLTRDNVPTLEMSGEPVNARDGAETPLRPELLSELGMKDFKSNQDIRVLDVIPGDRFLLCTDGLTDSVDDSGINRVLANERNARSAAFELVHLAVDNGAKDDVTALVFAVNEVPARARDSDITMGLLGRWQRFLGRAISHVRPQPQVVGSYANCNGRLD